MSLNAKEFSFLADLIRTHSGIYLTADKEYLLENRLLPLAKELGLNTLNELISHLQKKQDALFLVRLIEAMTTNESFFFRDIKPFKGLCDVIVPHILSKNPGKKNLRIWSAACSTGQEAYSILMSIMEVPALAGIQCEIIATDLDRNVLDKASKGLYSQFEVQRGVPINLLLKYFTQQGEQWQIKDILTKQVKFQQFNLLQNPAALGKFDIIFCRNVLIYFNDETKEKVLTNLRGQMHPHAALILGSTENLLGMGQNLKMAPFPDDKALGLTSGMFCLKE